MPGIARTQLVLQIAEFMLGGLLRSLREALGDDRSDSHAEQLEHMIGAMIGKGVVRGEGGEQMGKLLNEIQRSGDG